MADRTNKLAPPNSWPQALPTQTGKFLAGPPLPSGWPRPGKRIRLDAVARRTAVEPWHKVGLGPRRVVLQIVTRWD